jgi:hypothetical protein
MIDKISESVIGCVKKTIEHAISKRRAAHHSLDQFITIDYGNILCHCHGLMKWVAARRELRRAFVQALPVK